MYAMQHNHASIVTRLLSIPHIRLDYTNTYGWTALHIACSYNSASLIAIFGQDSRCSPAILNMRDSSGYTAVMAAVNWGHLDCVKEMDKLPGTDFTTKNAAGESLIDVARRENSQAVLEYLLAKNSLVATKVATNTLERMNLREIAEEMDNTEEMDAVMLSEKQLMETRHATESARHSEEQASECAQMKTRQKEQTDGLSEKQRNESKELERLMMENKQK